MSHITQNVRRLLAELPPGVQLVAVAKGRTPAQIKEALDAGAGIIGENYLQEARAAFAEIGQAARWHFIGHLQRNKVKPAVALADMIETVDSPALAAEIDKRCREIGKIMPVLIEVNSAREPHKSGVLPEQVMDLVRNLAALPNIRVQGLMTMGPLLPDPAGIRPCFQETKRLFADIQRLRLPGVEMLYLSMGMSESYRIAIEEGANLVRLGRAIFDPIESRDVAK